MAKMWRNMYESHHRQEEIVADLRALNTSNATDKTTDHHHGRTVQLYNVVNEWHIQSNKLVIHQKEYISALNNWLRLNLVPIESNLKEKVSSPQRADVPPIHNLLQAWHNVLGKLPDTVAIEAIKTFAAIIQRIVQKQEDELKQKLKCDDAESDYKKKSGAFEEWEKKYKEKKGPEENNGERTEANNRDPLVEKKVAIELLKIKVDEEKVKYTRACEQTREMSFTSLRTGLPSVFKAMAGFAHDCSEVYKELHVITLTQKPLQNGQ